VLEADAEVERAVEAVLQERAEAFVATGLEARSPRSTACAPPTRAAPCS
jgi:hypothetical protein